ncbi:hypothetical protein PT974_09670 [Cladobotryum mycophilum]|uniref:Uncharacterized protein n=1 Tax=Cladobotryum mycophilum TaxID=491253 RepID=A0ABR0SGS6_9HYPO
MYTEKRLVAVELVPEHGILLYLNVVIAKLNNHDIDMMLWSRIVRVLSIPISIAQSPFTDKRIDHMKSAQLPTAFLDSKDDFVSLTAAGVSN